MNIHNHNNIIFNGNKLTYKVISITIWDDNFLQG